MRLGNAKAGAAGAVAYLLLLTVQASSAQPGCLAVLGGISCCLYSRSWCLRPPRDEPRLRGTSREALAAEQLHPGRTLEEQSQSALRETNETSTSVGREATEDSSTDPAVEAILTLRATLEESIQNFEQKMIAFETNLDSLNSTVACQRARASRTEERLESLSSRLSAQDDDVTGDASVAACAEHIGVLRNKTDHVVSATALELGTVHRVHNETNHSFADNKTTSSAPMHQEELVAEASFASAEDDGRQEKENLLARIAELEKQLTEVSGTVSTTKPDTVHNETNRSFAENGTRPSTLMSQGGLVAEASSASAENNSQKLQDRGSRIAELEDRLTEVVAKSAQDEVRLTRIIEEAGKVEAFSLLPLELVQRILVQMKEQAWPEWQNFTVATRGAGHFSSPITKEGVVLNVSKHANGDADVSVRVSEEPVGAVAIAGGAFVGIDCEVYFCSSWFQPSRRTISDIFLGGHGKVWREHVTPELLLGDSCQVCFRVRRSKLHVQCQVLLECVKAKLPPEAQEEPLIVSAFELLRDKQGLGDLREMLVEYMAAAFAWDSGREVLNRLSLDDIEAIITHPRLRTPADGEFFVLKAALDWAQSSGRPDLYAGAVVRVKNDSECEEWRGAECTLVEKCPVVGKICLPHDGDSVSRLWEVENASGESHLVEAKDLMCPGHIGLEQLLQHVRFPFIKLEQMQTLLSKKECALLRCSPAFVRGMRETVEVQAGKRRAEDLGERARQRDTSDVQCGPDCRDSFWLRDRGRVALTLLA